jgi:hypothetical protein
LAAIRFLIDPTGSGLAISQFAEYHGSCGRASTVFDIILSLGGKSSAAHSRVEPPTFDDGSDARCVNRPAYGHTIAGRFARRLSLEYFRIALNVVFVGVDTSRRSRLCSA